MIHREQMKFMNILEVWQLQILPQNHGSILYLIILFDMSMQ